MSAKMRELHYDKHHKAYVGIPQQADDGTPLASQSLGTLSV